MVSRVVRSRRKLRPFGVELLQMAPWLSVLRYARWLGVALPNKRSTEGFADYKVRACRFVARALARGEHEKR